MEEVDNVLSVSDLVEILEKKSEKIKYSSDQAQVTVQRGRLIKKIKAEIEKIKNQENLSTEDLALLEKIQEMLASELNNHKNQLANRYKSEFSEQKATFKAIFTVLPKGVSLQVKRIANCIAELKEAKTNKEKIFGMLEVAKQTGLLVATPVVFTAKFIVRHWYLLLLLLLFLMNSNDFDLGKLFKPDTKNEHVPELEPAPQPVVKPEPIVKPEPAPEPVPVPVPQPESEPVPSLEPIPQPVPNPIPNPVVVEKPDIIVDPVPDVEPVPVVPTVPVVEPVGELVPTDNYFELLRQALPSYYDSYTVYNTFEDAVASITEELGCTEEYAIQYLNGGLGYMPSIMWLVGEKGYYANNYVELMQNYSIQELEQIIADNEVAINDLVTQSLNFESIGEFIQTLEGPALVAFLAYELLQYGLAIPSGGVSLLLPG